MPKILITLLFLVQFSFAQTKITGIVSDSDAKPVVSASVILKDTTQKILAFTYTDTQGKYAIETSQISHFSLTYNSLSFTPLTLKFEYKEPIIRNVTLDKDAKQLEDVVITHTKPFTEKGDTLIFNAESFLQGNESVIEDLLKKIPGINVDADGKIKHGDKEIEKIMIEGDDFFEKGYRLISKNMPVKPINKVELHRNYSNNKHLKGIENSDKVALNLTLKEDHKARWFGNLTVGIGTQNRFEGKANLMKFSKKNKYYFLADANNTGYDASGEVSYLMRSVNSDEPGNIGDSESANSLLSAGTYAPNLSAKRTSLNNDQLISLNAIHDLGKKTKLKTLLFYKNERLDAFRNSFQDYFTLNFSNTEEYSARKILQNGFGKLDISHDFSKKSTFQYIFKINKAEGNTRNSIVFNQNPLQIKLNNEQRFLDQKMIFTHKISERGVWVFALKHLTEVAPQKLNSSQFLFDNLFDFDAKHTQQKSKNQLNYWGASAEYILRLKDGDLWESKWALENRKDHLNSEFTLFSDSLFYNPVDFQNDLNYQKINSYWKNKYEKKWKSFRFSGNLDFHFLQNKIADSTQNIWFINPRFGVNWKMAHKQKVNLSSAYNTTNADLSNIYNGFIQTSYRNFSRGLNTFQQLKNSSYTGTYTYGSYSDQFFCLFLISYIKNHDFLSSNSFINPNYTLTETLKIPNRDFLLTNLQLDYYLKSLRSNLKVLGGYNYFQFKNQVNGSELREIHQKSANYGFELRSAFAKFFNYHFGTKWTTTSVSVLNTENQFTNNVSFLDLNFQISTKGYLRFQTENYHYGNLQKGNRQFRFLDVEGKYTLKENKINLFLRCNNLFGTNNFTNFTLTDIYSSTVTYRLQPRYVLLKTEIRL